MDELGYEFEVAAKFWTEIDELARDLGQRAFHAAVIQDVLDNSFRRLRDDEPRTNLGGDEWANEWPKNSAWDFVALGKGHDTAFWTEFLRALHEVDPEMMVNIEHEDTELGAVEGLEAAAAVLRDADAALTASLAAN